MKFLSDYTLCVMIVGPTSSNGKNKQTNKKQIYLTRSRSQEDKYCMIPLIVSTNCQIHRIEAWHGGC